MKDKNELSTDDSGWLSILLPLVMTIAVSIGTTTIYQRLAAPEAQAASENQVLILSLKDWMTALPGDSDEDDVSAHFAKARAAADRAAAHGYIVLNESQAVAFPTAVRLKPGMFEQEGKK